MEDVKCISCSMHPVPSPSGALIAVVEGSQLSLLSTENRNVVRTIALDDSFAKSVVTVRWCRPPCTNISANGKEDSDSDTGELLFDDQRRLRSQRLLLANEDTVRVWSTQNPSWDVKIANAGAPVGKIGHVNFGHNEDTVLLFSAFKVRLMVCSLRTGRSIDLRDPKFMTKGFGYRPGSGHLALLTRPGAYDIATIHDPGTMKQIAYFTPITNDAQGLKWSPDGRWLAIWDSPAYGYNVSIYTPDGNLFRTYCAEEEDDNLNNGIRCLEWSPGRDYLAIGGSSMRVTLLGTKTFSPKIYLEHTTTVKLPSITIWQEQLLPGNGRNYIIAPQPICPPTEPTQSANVGTTTPTNEPTKSPKATDVSVLSFNIDGTLLATRTDAMPTTLWIWSIKSLTPKAILVHHSPIKTISWHPKVPDLLMFQCACKDAVVYHWKATWSHPRVTGVPLDNTTNCKYEAQWINTPKHRRPLFTFGNMKNFLLCQLQGDNEDFVFYGQPPISAETRTQMQDEALKKSLKGKTGRSGASSPAKQLKDIADDDDFDETLDWIINGEGNNDEEGGEPEDTFRFRKHIPVSS